MRRDFKRSVGGDEDSCGVRGSPYHHGNVVVAAYDYRVLQPTLVTDPNGNRQAAAFDALGMLVKVAIMGKSGDYTTVVDWIDLATETSPATIASVADALLDAETFETSWTFDAMSRVLTMTTPDDSVTAQTYSRRGLVDALAVNIRGAMSATDIVTAVAYNARGQRS